MDLQSFPKNARLIDDVIELWSVDGETIKKQWNFCLQRVPALWCIVHYTREYGSDRFTFSVRFLSV